MHVVQTAVLGTDDPFPCIQTKAAWSLHRSSTDSSSYLNAIGAATAADFSECRNVTIGIYYAAPLLAGHRRAPGSVSAQSFSRRATVHRASASVLFVLCFCDTFRRGPELRPSLISMHWRVADPSFRSTLDVRANVAKRASSCLAWCVGLAIKAEREKRDRGKEQESARGRRIMKHRTRRSSTHPTPPHPSRSCHWT
jgi:hypothetical protein